MVRDDFDPGSILFNHRSSLHADLSRSFTCVVVYSDICHYSLYIYDHVTCRSLDACRWSKWNQLKISTLIIDIHFSGEHVCSCVDRVGEYLHLPPSPVSRNICLAERDHLPLDYLHRHSHRRTNSGFSFSDVIEKFLSSFTKTENFDDIPVERLFIETRFSTWTNYHVDEHFLWFHQWWLWSYLQ